MSDYTDEVEARLEEDIANLPLISEHAADIRAALGEIRRLREIVMAVERKFPGETRVQTALRYVREAEARANEPGQARAALRGGGE